MLYWGVRGGGGDMIMGLRWSKWTCMHEVQIKLKADSPYSLFARVQKSISPSTCTSREQPQKQLRFVYFQIREDPCFTNNAMHGISKTWNWLDTAWQQFTEFKVQGNYCRCQWLGDLCPFKILLSSLCRLCWLYCVLVQASKFAWLICGVQWYIGD